MEKKMLYDTLTSVMDFKYAEQASSHCIDFVQNQNIWIAASSTLGLF